jgi:hypothetical protein
MERWADGCRPYGTWFHLFGASPRLTPWALSCHPFGARGVVVSSASSPEILFLLAEGPVGFPAAGVVAASCMGPSLGVLGEAEDSAASG